MSIKQDTDYVGLKVWVVYDPFGTQRQPVPATIVSILGLGDYEVVTDDGESFTVNECDIWDSLEDYERA
jgi:hypothetical protein